MRQILVVLIGAACITPFLAFGAFAQQLPERLIRHESKIDKSDGKLEVAANATLGNLVVDQYGTIGGYFSNPKADRQMLIEVLKPTMCNMASSAGIAAEAAKPEIMAMDSKARAHLKARDPQALTDLSIAILAQLDGVTANAISTDEMLGPGVYHNAIAGMSASLDACGFFGLEPDLMAGN